MPIAVKRERCRGLGAVIASLTPDLGTVIGPVYRQRARGITPRDKAAIAGHGDRSDLGALTEAEDPSGVTGRDDGYDTENVARCARARGATRDAGDACFMGVRTVTVQKWFSHGEMLVRRTGQGESMAWFGVDIGGSGVRAARLSDEGTPLQWARRTLVEREWRAVCALVVEAIQELCGAGESVDGVGVAVPGFVHGGCVVASPNFPMWDQVNIAGDLARTLDAPVVVENDANAAALGVAKGHRDAIVLTLGTGVGGGILSGGQLVRGASGFGAEVGHVFAGGSRRCGCGAVGCLESSLGTWGLIAAAQERGLPIASHSPRAGEELAAMAREGDTAARQVFEEASEALGRGLVTLVNLFQPSHIYILGGLVGARDLLSGGIDHMHAHCIGASGPAIDVAWLGRADDAAVRGVAWAAMQRAHAQAIDENTHV